MAAVPYGYDMSPRQGGTVGNTVARPFARPVNAVDIIPGCSLFPTLSSVHEDACLHAIISSTIYGNILRGTVSVRSQSAGPIGDPPCGEILRSPRNRAVLMLTLKNSLHTPIHEHTTYIFGFSFANRRQLPFPSGAAQSLPGGGFVSSQTHVRRCGYMREGLKLGNIRRNQACMGRRQPVLRESCCRR